MIEDLESLKDEIITAIKEHCKPAYSIEKDLIKTDDVLNMLGISAGTLQTLRKNGTIPYSKFGGILFYKKSEILKIISDKFNTQQ